MAEWIDLNLKAQQKFFELNKKQGPKKSKNKKQLRKKLKNLLSKEN
jgi:hypothetical protein